MKLSDIKTRKQFNEFADIWYQRVHQLREVWQNEETNHERYIKSFRLWLLMTKRVMYLTQIAIKFSQTKMPSSFKKGDETAKINKLNKLNK